MTMRACLIPFALLCFAGATAYSQGLYAPAPYLIDGNTLGTTVYGYPADNPPCNVSVYLWSSLGGDYLTSGSSYPNDTQISDSVSPSLGANITWSYGFSYTFEDPYANCDTYSYSFSSLVSLHQGYYGGLTAQSGNGFCYYAYGACTSGSNVCNYVNVSFGVYPAGCPSIIRVRYGVLTVNGSDYCVGGVSWDGSADNPRACY